MDTDEEMSREAYQSQRDAAAPRCRKCRQPENQVALLCEQCATETEWELEGCCDEHAAAMASRLRQRLAAAPAALRTQPRRVA